MFSVDSVAPVSRTFFETRGSKLSINNIEIQAAVTALEEARRLEYPQVRLCTSSTMLLAIVTKHLQQWKQKKWKRCNGSRLTLPISLLKKLDRLLAALDVEAEWSTLHSPLSLVEVLVRQLSYALNKQLKTSKASFQGFFCISLGLYGTGVDSIHRRCPYMLKDFSSHPPLQ